MTAQQESVSVFNDFYGNNPEYNDPQYYPIVLQTAQALLKETGVQKYDENFRKALVSRLKASGIVGKGQTTPAAPKPKNPAMFGGNSARPAAQTKGNTEAEQIAELF